MKEISISLLLKNMVEENNYADDIWKTCLNEKGKRYKIKDIKNALNKLEALGFIKKITISRTDKYYNKESYSNPDDYIGFVNNIIFSNESKIKESLKKLENKKIFVDISKDLNSYKLGERTKKDYEKLLDTLSDMMELASSIILIKNASNSEKLKNKLTTCYDEIKETLDQTNKKIIRDRKSNEIIILQRRFAGRIPSTGYLKL
ncbi:MAG: hypothetical protein OEM77_04850 [Nitrosopumilus sp.]|nr:hypothetical protein [Nitrosopumilus sp.]